MEYMMYSDLHGSGARRESSHYQNKVSLKMSLNATLLPPLEIQSPLTINHPDDMSNLDSPSRAGLQPSYPIP